ncbi:TonB family protein [Brevundimonas sp.]|uniref:TonB family protein n=1 Tax=Brevundimonas sp. TaxID=1871086 RepID=UPI0025B7BF79|nr:TonB family protein [Brevundimonas sp.]
MIARCTRGRNLDVVMTLGQPVAQPHVAVDVTLGDTEPNGQRWRLSEDGAVLFARQPGRLSSSFVNGRSAVISLTPDEGPRHRYELGAPSNPAVLAQVLSDCGQSTAWPPPDGSVLTNPDWIRRPTRLDFARLYPSFAAENGIDGEALVQCRVAVNGRVEDCIILSESPEGHGFGAASAALAQEFRMTPLTVDDRPYGEALIQMPINWRMR